MDIGSKKILLILFFFAAVFQTQAQSRYLDKGISGSGFRINTAADDTGIVSGSLAASYSIGGIMDVGFQLSRDENTVRGIEVVEWNYAFLYNIIIVKQTEFNPLNFQLEGSFGYSNIDSESSDQIRADRGFAVGASVFHRFFPQNPFSLTLGVKGVYRNYLYFYIPPADDPVEERELDSKYGGFAAFTFRTGSGPLLTLETEILYNHSESGFLVQPSILFTTPLD